jgi:hypothetical protein
MCISSFSQIDQFSYFLRGESMKATSKFWISGKLLVPALLTGMLLTACGEKEMEAPADAAPAAEAPAEAAPAAPAVEAAPATPEAGGYVPTADELIPGITVPQEELDKKNAELLKDTPKAVIPGEAPAAPVEAPAEEAK